MTHTAPAIGTAAYPGGIAQLRAREYRWEPGEAMHFDHASVGPLPQRTRDALDAYGLKRAEPHRLGFDDFFPVLDKARGLAARLIGASAAEMVLTTNTSWGVNLAAYALPLGPGDIVLGSEGEFPANVYPWMSAAKARGFTFELLPMLGTSADEETILRRLATDARVKCVALSWVSFWSGARIDLDAIGAACRARGAWFAVDAIQGLGPLALDVRRTSIDILSCGAQKWLCSPWGSGFAYVRQGLVDALEPPAAGWLSQASSGDFSRFLDYDAAWHPEARRFEVGTIPYQDIVGMNASLELLLELGPAAIEAHVRTITRRLIDGTAHLRGARLITPAEDDRRAGIVAITTPDLDGDSKKLRAAKVTHSVREGAIRLSPHFHNSIEDIDAVIGALTR